MESRKDFQKARLVVFLIVITEFLLYSFQCALCGKRVKPQTAGEFHKHLRLTHHEGEDFCKCTFSECNYVRCFPLDTLSILFLKGTYHQDHMRRHVRQVHEGLDRMDCPCCGMSSLR